MDSLFEQFSNISKAQGYDIVSKQVIELKQVIRELISKGELEDIQFTDQDATEEFKRVLHNAKMLSL